MSFLRFASRGLLIFVALLIILPGNLFSQSTVGIQPLGSYASNFDQINLANLAVHVDIPLFTHKARGQNMGTSLHLIYDTGTGVSVSGPWSLSGGTASAGVIGFATFSSPCLGQGSYPGETYSTYNYWFTDSTGYTHVFNGTSISGGCSNGSVVANSLNEAAADGSGYFLSASGPGGNVTSPSGVVVTQRSGPYQQVSDSNGNTGVQGFGCTVTGVQCPSEYTFTDNSNVQSLLEGGVPSSGKSTLTYSDTSGNTQGVVIAYQSYSMDVLAGSPLTYTTYPISLVQSITYPDGTSYQFTYQPSPHDSSHTNGNIATITLPTGGTIAYATVWSTTNDCGATSLTRTTSDGTTQYARSDNSSAGVLPCNATTTTTSIAKPDGSTETVQSVISNYLPASLGGYGPYYLETAHSWKTASETVVKSSMKCYNGASGTCTTTPVSIPVTEISTTTTLPNVGSSKAVEFLNTAYLPTEVDEYDFGASIPARTTKTVYASLGNNIQDRPSTVTVTDGSNHLYAQTSYSYDQYTLASVSPPGLTTPSGARGNPTTVTKYVLGSSSVVTNSHYDDAGQVVSTTDGRVNTTSYGYDSTDTYVASITYPPVAAGTFSEAFMDDPNTGLLIQSTDKNGRITSYTYDLMLRNIGICHPDGGYTQTAYPSENEAEVAVLTGTGSGCNPTSGVPSGPWATSTSQYDGYGRLVESTDPVGDTTDITYDSMGREYSVSNPHGPGGIDGAVNYLYDILGEKTKQANQDGSVQYWCYDDIPSAPANQPNCHSHIGSVSGRWVDFQDEDGHQWQQTSDAIGRLSEVEEPNATGAGAPMETDYAYNPLNDLLSVTQWGGTSGSSGARTRTFTYDGLSQLMSSTNPETGTTVYTHDPNGNISTRTDGRGVTTTYTYDTWNRVLSKNDQVTALSSCYQYDLSASSNGIGRLANEWTQSASAGPCAATLPASGFWTKRSILNYDPMGRVRSEQQYAPFSSTTGTTFSPTYTYDLAGNLVTSTSGIGPTPTSAPITLTNAYDGAGHLLTITSNWNDSTHPQSIFSPPTAQSSPCSSSSNLQYTPFGSLLNAEYGDSLALSRAYDNRLRITCEIDTGRVPNGSGGQQ